MRADVECREQRARFAEHKSDHLKRVSQRPTTDGCSEPLQSRSGESTFEEPPSRAPSLDTRPAASAVGLFLFKGALFCEAAPHARSHLPRSPFRYTHRENGAAPRAVLVALVSSTVRRSRACILLNLHYTPQVLAMVPPVRRHCS